MSLRRLLVATALLTACTTADGEVFVTRDVAPLPCQGTPFQVVAAEDPPWLWGGAVSHGAGVHLITATSRATLHHELTLFPATLSGGVATTVVAEQAFMGAAKPVVDGSGSLQLVFQNHSLAGKWHIYAADAGLGSPAIESDYLRISSAGVENIGPHAAWSNGKLAVAYRQDTRVEFALAQAQEVTTRTSLAAELPHPVLGRVLAWRKGEGFTVLYRRTRFVLSQFGPEGDKGSDVDVAGSVVDAVAGEDGVTAIAGTGATLERLQLSAPSASPVRTALPTRARGDVATLRVAVRGSWLGVALSEIEGDAHRARFMWWNGDQMAGGVFATLGQLEGGILDVIAVDPGALVLFYDGGVLKAQLVCGPPP